MAQVCCHDSQLKGLLRLVQIVVTLGEDRPCGRGAWFYADDFLHEANSFWDVVVDICCVSVTDEIPNLL
jgi:hypothetical protein